MTIATYVLVHGAYHGAWCWKRVVDRLRAAGHAVHAPTQTGSGERTHLRRPGLDLDVYVEDVLGVIDAEELRDVILVGHSFGGMTITGVADRRPEALRHLVYLDAIVPLDGESASGRMTAELREERNKQARDLDGTPCFMPPAPGYFGVSDATDSEWVRRRLTPMAASLFSSALRLQNPAANGRPATYIRCTDPAMKLLDISERRAREAGWQVFPLATGHNAMISQPDQLTELLISRAG